MGDFNLFKDIFNNLLELLPVSPFKGVINVMEGQEFQDFLSVFNWFVPVKDILVIFGFYLTAVTGYYLWAILLRWINAIR